MRLVVEGVHCVTIPNDGCDLEILVRLQVLSLHGRPYSFLPVEIVYCLIKLFYK